MVGLGQLRERSISEALRGAVLFAAGGLSPFPVRDFSPRSPLPLQSCYSVVFRLTRDTSVPGATSPLSPVPSCFSTAGQAPAACSLFVLASMPGYTTTLAAPSAKGRGAVRPTICGGPAHSRRPFLANLKPAPPSRMSPVSRKTTPAFSNAAWMASSVL